MPNEKNSKLSSFYAIQLPGTLITNDIRRPISARNVPAATWSSDLIWALNAENGPIQSLQHPMPAPAKNHDKSLVEWDTTMWCLTPRYVYSIQKCEFTRSFWSSSWWTRFSNLTCRSSAFDSSSCLAEESSQVSNPTIWTKQSNRSILLILRLLLISCS